MPTRINALKSLGDVVNFKSWYPRMRAHTPKTTVSINSLGKSIGLKTKWTGTRPILKDKGIRSLAKSEAVACCYYFEIKRKKNLLARFWDWIRTVRTFSAASFTIGFSEIENDDLKKKGEQTLIRVHETHINAWVKCFNDCFPNSGFYRIWDYEASNFSDKKIEELFDVAQLICEKIPRKNCPRMVIKTVINSTSSALSKLWNN